MSAPYFAPVHAVFRAAVVVGFDQSWPGPVPRVLSSIDGDFGPRNNDWVDDDQLTLALTPVLC